MLLTSDLSGLVPAIKRLRRELPGWLFTVGECQVSCDATVFPMGDECDSDLLNHRDIEPRFDSGFDCDLRQPSTLAEALNGAIDDALEARAKFKS
jgi:hypothetical protein